MLRQLLIYTAGAFLLAGGPARALCSDLVALDAPLKVVAVNPAPQSGTAEATVDICLYDDGDDAYIAVVTVVGPEFGPLEAAFQYYDEDGHYVMRAAIPKGAGSVTFEAQTVYRQRNYTDNDNGAYYNTGGYYLAFYENYPHVPEFLDVSSQDDSSSIGGHFQAVSGSPTGTVHWHNLSRPLAGGSGWSEAPIDAGGNWLISNVGRAGDFVAIYYYNSAAAEIYNLSGAYYTVRLPGGN